MYIITVSYGFLNCAILGYHSNELHIFNVKVKAEVILRMAVSRELIRLGTKPFETHDQSFFSTQPWRS
jgi:uncharacterized phage-like protein YoqJ